MNSNPYGQNYSTGGGGGFMASDSQGSQGGEKKTGDQGLRPVTVRQIINADHPNTDAEFLIDGREVDQISLVGVVRNVSAFPTNVSYSVDDGSGTIEVRKWLDSSTDETVKISEILVNSHIRILGKIKAFQNKRSVSALHIRLITDFNEVSFHKLDAIYAHLSILRGGARGISSGGAAAADNKASSSNKYNNIGDALQRKLMQLIDGMLVTDDEEGVPVPALAKRCPGVTLDQVRAAIDSLVSDGYLYTTSDDDHVLCT